MQYVVYKITCNSPEIDHLYIGSSRNLKLRTRKHKYDSKDERCTSKVYTVIRDHGGLENWTIEVMESGTCETEFEIKGREKAWYDDLLPNLNTYRPQASKEERRLVKKQYYKKNLDKLKKYQSQYHEKNKQYRSQKVQCDTCNCECRKGDLAKHNKTQKHLNNLQMMSNAQ